MRRFVLLVVAGSAVAAAGTLFAQTSHVGAPNWTPPKTAWGEPDLQGTWTNETITPFERPKHLADKPFLTKEEAADIERQAARQRDNADSAARPGDVGSYNQFWFDSGTKVVSSRQTSLVVDPPDGRVPLRPEAEKIKEEVDARNSDSFEFMSPWDRCITRGVPGGFFPAGYNNAYQILQTPGYVVIHYEMIHAARVIPIGRPHLPSTLRFWDGDSIGRWEGNTLVIDTVGYNDKFWFDFKGHPHTEMLHTIERYTRKNVGTLVNEVTIEDPGAYVRPFKLTFTATLRPGDELMEYICQENNQDVAHIQGPTTAPGDPERTPGTLGAPTPK